MFTVREGTGTEGEVQQKEKVGKREKRQMCISGLCYYSERMVTWSLKRLNVAIREGSMVRRSFQIRDAVYTKAEEEDLTLTKTKTHTHTHTI